MLEIALASQSPRRRELLSQAAFSFRVFPVKVSEIIDENLKPAEVASQIATVKVQACVEQNKELKQPGFLVLGADTIVVLGAKILGKPENFSQAQHYLRSLSGKTHRVITGFTLLESGSTKVWSGAEMTEVKFKILGEKEIDDYISTGEPMDKAGAYAIQGGAAKFVSSFTGSKSNVIGLPLERLEKVLQENGWNVRRGTPARP
ncbi:MAG: Maf family protein [Bdellovibrionales bacterium]